MQRRFASRALATPTLRNSFVPAVGITLLWGCAPTTTSVRFYCEAKPPAPEGQQVGGDVKNDPDTHPDFQPKANTSAIGEAEMDMVKKDILDSIRDDEVVLFMKGLPDAPVCGFSKVIVDILDQLGLEYTSFDVLAHPVVRSYVKEVSGWPTIPQVFIKGEFAGGADVIQDMAADGSLQMMLENKKISHRPGKIPRRT